MEYELLLLTLSRNARAQASYFRDCIGQHMIASYLAQRGFRAKVYSGDILDAEQVIAHEISACGIRYLGFYVGADTVVMVGNLIRHLKRTTDTYILVGGPEAIALGEDFLQRTGCDAIIAGEGERSVFQLLSWLEDGAGDWREISGLRYIDRQGVYQTVPVGEPIMDLDSLPWPDPKNSLQKRYRMNPSIGILTGRGCPFHCAFCYEGAVSKRVRLRSVEHVMGEIDDCLSYNSSLRHVHFFDDTFTLYPERVYAFCRELERRNLKWTCEGHVSCLHSYPEMLERMVHSGLTGMQIGLESGSQTVLEAYEKNTTPAMIEDVVRLCRQAGLKSLEGNYIIGGAFESDKTLEESLAHAKRLLEAGRGMIELKTVFFSPYFGTPISRCPERFGMRRLPEREAQIVATMREPVTETQALPLRALIQWKEHFDSQLDQEYRRQAKLCTRDDLFRGGLPRTTEDVSNPTWYKLWLEQPHFREFLTHGSQEEQTYSESKYPIRTGLRSEDQGAGFSVCGIPLTPIQAQVWLCADGRLTAGEIGEKLAIPGERLRQIYAELNQLCLVYFSPF